MDYWDDPVYRYLSRQHKDAVDGGDDGVEWADLMQALMEGKLADDRYEALTVEARDARKREKQKRKESQRRPGASRVDKGPGINTAELKKRIFNTKVSKENMIKAIQVLPPAERRATVEGLPPGLKRKLGKFYTDGKW